MGVISSMLDAVFPRTSTRHPELVGTTLCEERDVRGWDTAIMVDENRAQATINLEVTAARTALTETQWRGWEDDVCDLDHVVAACTVDEAGDGAWPHPRIAATFRAAGRTQRKHLDELSTDVSIRQAELYERSGLEQLGLMPMDSDRVLGAVAAAVGLQDVNTWEDVARLPVTSYTDTLIVNEQTSSATFVVDISDNEVAATLDEIMADWEGQDRIRRTRFFRPYVLPRTGQDTVQAGYGRRWALVTVTGSELAEVAFRAVMDHDPAVGLRVRRLRGRQRTGLLAGLGIGVLAWQHITAADTTGVV